MFKGLKCKLGFHDWHYSQRTSRCDPIRRYCIRCERRERLLPGAWMGLPDIWRHDKIRS